jgi:hypothetical protein
VIVGRDPELGLDDLGGDVERPPQITGIVGLGGLMGVRLVPDPGSASPAVLRAGLSLDQADEESQETAADEGKLFHGEDLFESISRSARGNINHAIQGWRE